MTEAPLLKGGENETSLRPLAKKLELGSLMVLLASALSAAGFSSWLQ
jgi:hypothetical protein